jgi:predicted nucleic acid-binding protein
MPQLLWDASALAKRYTPEVGSDVVDACFDSAIVAAMITTCGVYAEACSVLRRKQNRGEIDAVAFTKARSVHRSEVLLGPSLQWITIEEDDILAGIALSDRHNLNSTDAALLVAYLDYTRSQSSGAPTCLLVAADHHLLRAAASEGLDTLNPERVPAADVPALLASL